MFAGNVIVFVIILVIGLQDCVLAASLSPRSTLTCKNLPSSKDQKRFNQSFKGTPYIAEITRKFLKLQTLGCEPLEIELTENESKEIQKLSYDFVNLLDSSKISSSDEAEVLNWKDLNPIILLTNSEISIRFVKAFRNSSSTHEPERRYIYWKFLTEYAKNVFQNKLKELNVTILEEGSNPQFNENESIDEFDNFKNFLDTLWKIIKISINYAEDNLKEWTSMVPEMTPLTTPKAITNASAVLTTLLSEEATPPTSPSSEDFNVTTM